MILSSQLWENREKSLRKVHVVCVTKNTILDENDEKNYIHDEKLEKVQIEKTFDNKKACEKYFLFTLVCLVENHTINTTTDVVV